MIIVCAHCIELHFKMNEYSPKYSVNSEQSANPAPDNVILPSMCSNFRCRLTCYTSQSINQFIVHALYRASASACACVLKSSQTFKHRTLLARSSIWFDSSSRLCIVAAERFIVVSMLMLMLMTKIICVYIYFIVSAVFRYKL